MGAAKPQLAMDSIYSNISNFSFSNTLERKKMGGTVHIGKKWHPNFIEIYLVISLFHSECTERAWLTVGHAMFSHLTVFV